MEFDLAVRLLANNLLDQAKKSMIYLLDIGVKTVAVAPFVDAKTGEVVKVSRDIERIIISELGQTGKLAVKRMTALELDQANYILIGTIGLEPHPDAVERKQHFHVSASLVARKSTKIIANSSVWISNSNLDYTPVAVYENSPMFPRDQRLESLVRIATSAAGQPADSDYYNSLETNALIAEAETAYESKQYDIALPLFKRAAERSEGQVMKTYIGLYKANMKLGHAHDAEAAFSKLVAVGVDNNNLSTKFLFAVDSADFISDNELRRQYLLWLRQIGKYFDTSQRCVNIIGHCSRTGTAAYNQRLSLVRAQRIQAIMQRAGPSVTRRSKAIGKGFAENIVGSGTDDARDALDRRVEFAVVGCQ